MLEDLVYSPTLEYRTGELFNPRDLYAELFENSQKCDLLLGYFSSTAIKVLSRSFSEFISKGGVLRVLANTVVSADDLQLFDNSKQIDLLDIDKLEDVYHHLSGSQKNFFECLRFLMNHDRIQIRFIQPKTGRGIAHFKSSVFQDSQDDAVYCKGSCNFTASGLLYNLEEMFVSCSWDSDHNGLRVDEFKNYFNQIWEGENSNVDLADTAQIKNWVDSRFEALSLNEVVKILTSRQEDSTFVTEVDDPKPLFNEIKFPFESGPRGYQQKALDNWLANNRRGLFAMATGTGKTLTALNCLLYLYNANSYYRAIIVVPTSALMLQWEDQVNKFGFKDKYIFNKLTAIQKKTLELINADPLESNFILVISYSAFSKSKFQTKFSRMITNSVVIADEAHNSSAPKASKVFSEINPLGILGLSATPEKRFQDTDLFYQRVFGSKFPHTFSYTMKTAIDNEILTPYKYYPIPVEMEPDEFDNFDRVTQLITQLTSRDKLSNSEKEQLKNLSIYRRSIINSAIRKEVVVIDVLNDIRKRQGDLRYTLIYAPVGYEKTGNHSKETEDLEHRIVRYTEKIRANFPDATIAQFAGGMKKTQSDSLITSFENGSNHMLISMKCLDEGVDIPIAKNALFISSSGSPREFIQRRGRVLRKHEEKIMAHVYDLYVVPPKGSYPSNATRKIAKDEIIRLQEFAELAMNKAEVLNLISLIEKSYQ